MILFMTCMFAAGHGGGPFIMAEVFAIIGPFVSPDTKETMIILPVVALHIAGFIAIKRSYDRLMFGVVILLSLIVIAATIVSREALNFVIWTNSAFLITAVVYIIRYFREKEVVQTEPEAETDDIV
ncbi:MAG: hypothetical protein JWQ57_729 [Mucilaginibacter sp.]|nr:hypothetical protein [Mucilaginibacter sp.]